jgi:peptidoglycan/xylan/chitin deacetylase (PgdA/CDA1 family)
MSSWRNTIIDAGMQFFRVSGAHALAAPLTRGVGAVMMFHRVGPDAPSSFDPNRGLEISVEFFDALLERLRHTGRRILSLDAALAELREGKSDGAPFVVLTFDDGYRDLLEHALPVLERREAPFTAYVTSGFADGAARLWWVELEEAVRRLDRVDIAIAGADLRLPAESPAQKAKAFDAVYWRLRDGSEEELLRATAELCAKAGIEPLDLTRRSCLDWEALGRLARHELATIGAHSVTHARLAKLAGDNARAEMAQSRSRIEEMLGVEPKHFCYPVGDPTSAGVREFELARELGFESAVTTRPGVLFPEHREHVCALPRLSINGRHQNLSTVEILLSGAPFALVNRGRKVRAA